MMSISKWQSSNQAENYFQQDLDYYQKNQELGEWHITGEMKSRYDSIEHKSSITKESYQDFSDLINQNLKGNATGNQRAGFDITFSPSKSIDAIYAVADKNTKQQILQAQNHAVDIALEKASQYITYRMRDGEGGREHYKNNGLAIAKFQHLTNRNEEIKIHTHCFIANQTVNKKGELVSIDNKNLYDNQKLITQIYHQELFQQMQRLGFQSEVLDIQKDILEIRGVTQEARNSISTRTQEIENYLADHKKELLSKYPNANESQLRQIATLETRNYKQSHSYSEVEEIELRNKNLVEATGFTKESITEIQNLEKSNQKILSLEELTQKSATLATEQESTFTSEEILSRAIKLNAIQGYTYELSTLENAIQNSDIIKLDENIYTTEEMINIEREILNYAQSNKNTKEAETTKELAEQFLNEKFSTMTQGQKEAFSHVLTSKDAVLGIQGDAGVGKTYMLKAVKDFQDLQEKDNLIGLAPTNKAATEISKDSGIKGQTIDSFINQKEHKENQIIIVDEASMIDSRKMQKLTNIAEQTNSKLILMGDTKQFTSIGAGAIFEQLQHKGAIEVAVMAESMRAKTEEMKELYKLTKEQQTDKALDILEAKNQFHSIEAENYTQVVKEYLEHKDETLLLVMKNQTRQELNGLIRDELKKDNSISNHQILDIQEKQQLDSISAHHHTSYEVGNMVQQMESYKGGFKSGTETIITSINEELNTITLQDSKGNIKEVNLSEHGDKLNLYKTTQKEFSENDKIIFTQKSKDLGLNNGDLGTIKEINNGVLTINMGKREIQINTKEYNYIDHAYAITNHKAQGQTSERSIFVGDSRLSSQNAFYVALTRAKIHISIYTNDKEIFRDSVADRQTKRSTLDYNTQEILQRRADELTKIKRIHQSSDREIRGEPNSINLLHKLSNSNLVSDTRKFSDMLLQSDALNNLANRRGRDDNFTVRPTINGVGGITIETNSINNKGFKMQKLHTNIAMKSTGTRAGADMQYWSVGSVDKLNRFTGVIYDQTGNNSASTMFVIGDKVVPSSQFDKEFGLYNYTKEIQKYTDDIYEDRIYSDELGFSYIRENYRANDLAKELAQSSQNFSVVPPIQVGNTLFLEQKNTKSLDKTFMQLAKEFVLEKYYEFGDKFKEKIGQFWGSDKSLSAENVALQSKIKELEIRQAQIEEERKAELRELRKQFQDEKLTEMINMRKEQDVERITKEEKLNNKESFAIKLLVDLYSEFKTDDPSYRWSANHIQEIRQRGERINSIISNASDENKEKIQKYVTNLVNKGIGLYGSETSTYAHIKNGQIEKMQIGKVDEISKKFTGILIENNQVNCFLNNQHVEETELQSNQLGAQALKVFDNIAYINKSGKPKLYEYVQHHLEFKNGNFKGNLYGSGMKVQDTNDLQSNLVDKIPKGDSITWERMMKAHDYINDLSESFKILKDWEDLDLVEEMGGKYDLRNIDYQTFMNFKELAAEVYEDTLKIPNLDFETAMKVAVKASDMFTNNIEEKNTNKHKM